MVKRVLGLRSGGQFGPITCPFFQPGFPISVKWGWHLLLSRKGGHHGECEVTWLGPPLVWRESARLSLRLKPGVFTNRRTLASGLLYLVQPHPRILRVPEGARKKRTAMTSFQFNHSRLRPASSTASFRKKHGNAFSQRIPLRQRKPYLEPR